VNLEDGVESHRVTVLRDDLVRAVEHTGSPEEVWAHAEASSEADGYPDSVMLNPDRYPDFDWSTSVAFRQHTGGADEFFIWQLWARVRGELELTRNLSLTGAIGIDLYNNFDEMRIDYRSNLPQVRSDIRRYLDEGSTGITRLEADYLWKPHGDWYARLSGGLLEEMFGGVSGELLYRPYGARWAVGADLSWVKKRDYDMRFSFLDYDVVTGHATAYYDVPYVDLSTALSAGRYLAGDWGATLDVSRRFENGVRVGAFATKTNVSAEDFGEGSFDKGIYITVPIDLFWTRSSRNSVAFAWRPVTRDAGAMLNVGKRLYGVTTVGHPEALSRDWAALTE
jgi:hypothetical protein